MKKRRIASLFLTVALIAGGIVNSSTAAVTSKDYTDEELDCLEYDIEKYTQPFWEGNIVYNEVVFPIRDANGSLPTFELMYDATEIISVKSYRLDTVYEMGKDYLLDNGNLRILASGSIPVQMYTSIHTNSVPSDYDVENEFMPYYPHADTPNRWEYWTGGSDICEKAVVVTYIHNDTWDAPVPESQDAELPMTMEKLKNKEDLTIVVAGDSVSTGAMASGFLGMSPHADAYPEMTVKALREKYGNENITLINSAIGGTMSGFEQAKMDSTIINHNPDLVILNFGMNDSSCDRVGIPAEEFKANHVQQIDYIKEKLPECEVLLVSSLYGNRYTFPAERYEEHAAVLHELAAEYEGVGVADPQMIEKYLIEETGKDFLDFMADNMVHPGDFGMRLMAQTILCALDVTDIDAYKTLLIDNMTAYADPDSHVEDGKKEELQNVILNAASDIVNYTDEWDINKVITKAYDDITFILKRCAFDDHVFTHTLYKPTCKSEGYTSSVCTVCGYSYQHDQVAAIGGEHIMDSGRQTTSPTYKDAGVYTYSCAKCGYEEHESVPKLTNAPTLNNKGMLYINQSYNYMATGLNPYVNGSGYVEIDVCPLDTDIDGNPYIGVWFSRYAITACYNFRTQQVEIIETSLPYSGGTPFASKKVDWNEDNGKYKYNWKKFAVKISGSTNTVEIYLDGELMLSHTNSLYQASNEVALVYSVGEFYMDNFKVGKGNYDPVTGTGGEVIGQWDLDTQASVDSFFNVWGTQYSNPRIVKPTAESVTTGQNSHSHVVSYLNTVERGCALGGYKEYTCDICSKVIRMDHKDPIYAEGHTLINRYIMETPTEQTSGRCSYECETCYMTFTEILPAGSNVSPIIKGDIDGDGKVGIIDLTYLQRYLAGADMIVELERADMNSDGRIAAIDKELLTKKMISGNLSA